MSPTKIAIIGIGKIAQDQHLPVIAKNSDFRLVGVVSQRGLGPPGVPTFKTPAELYAALPDLDAVAICTPPHVRHRDRARGAGGGQACDAGEAAGGDGRRDARSHAKRARRRGRVIFATWHSQYNAAVDEAKERLAGQTLRGLAIEWKEDVRRWHPGQDWIWDAGNFGVFDPGINALSILTKIAPGAMFVKSAQLRYPENRDTPIAASLVFSSNAAAADARLTAEFDWRQEGDQSWNIDIETEAREAASSDPRRLAAVRRRRKTASMRRWPNTRAFMRISPSCCAKGESDMDSTPFQLVADAFLVGSRRVVEPFHW